MRLKTAILAGALAALVPGAAWAQEVPWSLHRQEIMKAVRASRIGAEKASQPASPAMPFSELRQTYYETERALLGCAEDCDRAQAEYAAARDAFWSARLAILEGNLPPSPDDRVRERYFRLDRNFGRLLSECREDLACRARLRAEYVEARNAYWSAASGPEFLQAVGGVDVSPLVGTYALKGNNLGDHPDNRCDAALVVRAVRDSYGERLEFLSPDERQRQDSTEDGEWKAIMVRQGYRYSGINAGLSSYRPDPPAGARPIVDMQERLERRVALVVQGPGALELTATFGYRDRFASGSAKDVFTLARDGTLRLVHEDMHTLKWYQYESGVDRSRPGYRKPNYDKNCEYSKTSAD